MILTKSIKLTYFFGFGILAFLLVVNADAKQADADYFDVGNNNLTVFSVNVFGQGYYDVNFELTVNISDRVKPSFKTNRVE
ncbi:hypothetical protein OAT28_05185 [Gammaproteobacteria bacterium]|nr:hypothetical protein [Gammaproteobacteria bacterium]